MSVKGSTITVKRTDYGRPKKKPEKVKTKQSCRFTNGKSPEQLKRALWLEGENDNGVMRIMHNASEGLLMLFYVTEPRKEDGKIVSDFVYTLFDRGDVRGETAIATFRFSKKRIFKCVPAGIDNAVGSYSMLVERAITQRNVVREEVRKSILKELACESSHMDRMTKCHIIRSMFQNDQEFQKKLRALVYFEVLSAVMVDAKKYR